MKTIHTTVRVGKVNYGPGQEDALAGVLSADQVMRLTATNVISGFDAKADKAAAEVAEEVVTQETTTQTTEETPAKGKGK